MLPCKTLAQQECMPFHPGLVCASAKVRSTGNALLLCGCFVAVVLFVKALIHVEAQMYSH